MSLITISRGSYSRGMQIAEKVAERLGYECVARDVLLEASEEFNIPEIKLLHALKDAPSLFERLTYSKERYVAFIQLAVLRRLHRDNVVYHGFAGHFFLKGVSHVLKVRIIADLDDRIKVVMERDGIARNKAAGFLKKLDRQRSAWSKYLYGIDTADPSLYDMVLHIHKLTVDDAVDLIAHAADLEHFKTTDRSRQAMDDLLLAAEVKAALIQVRANVDVSAEEGSVLVRTRAPESVEVELVRKMEKAAKKVPGVKDIRFQITPPTPFRE